MVQARGLGAGGAPWYGDVSALQEETKKSLAHLASRIAEYEQHPASQPIMAREMRALLARLTLLFATAPKAGARSKL